MTNYYLTIDDGVYKPISRLDHILTNNDLVPEYISIIDGTIVNKDNFSTLVDSVKENIKNKIYETTDHLPIKVVYNDVTYLYVSLDNSVRANAAGTPLYKRIINICNIIKPHLTDNTVIFFSEACRPSFDGSDRIAKKNEVTWFQLRRIIQEELHVEHLGESLNNSSELSFGVAAFCTIKACSNIYTVMTANLLPDGSLGLGGSGCLGIKMKDGSFVWGIHMPLDFKGIGKNNHGSIAITNLLSLMDKYPSSFAIGDFNTIPGTINDAMSDVLNNANRKLVNNPDIMTFFSSFSDGTKGSIEEEWKEFVY